MPSNINLVRQFCCCVGSVPSGITRELAKYIRSLVGVFVCVCALGEVGRSTPAPTPTLKSGPHGGFERVGTRAPAISEHVRHEPDSKGRGSVRGRVHTTVEKQDEPFVEVLLKVAART